MSKPVSHQLDIYGYWIHLTTTRKQRRQLAKQFDLEKLDVPNSLGRTERLINPETGGGHFVVWLDMERLRDLELIEIAAHDEPRVLSVGCKVSYCRECRRINTLPARDRNGFPAIYHPAADHHMSPRATLARESGGSFPCPL